MCKLKGQEDTIVKMYNNGSRIFEIATKYGVADTTIHRLLHKKKIPVYRKNIKPSIGRRKSKYNMKERVFSPEFLAKQKENTMINNKYIKYIKFENTTEDQVLITNILNRPIIG